MTHLISCLARGYRLQSKRFTIVVGMLLTPAFIQSQGLEDVAIFGFVTDQLSGGRISGVLVEAINEADTTQRASAVSDATGRYVMNLVTDIQSSGIIPSEFQLRQNYPNPFNPSTVISFAIAGTAEVRLEIFNTLGQRVRTLLNQTFSPGEYSTVWDASNEAGMGVAAGVYFYQLRTENFVQTKKMVLLDGGLGIVASLAPTVLGRPAAPLTKFNNITVTVRATSARIVSYERPHVSIDQRNFRFDIDVTVVQENVINPDLIVVSEPNAAGKVYISGLARAVIDTVVGTEKVTVKNTRTQEQVSMRVDKDGGIRLMSLQAQLEDELTLTLFKIDTQVGNSVAVEVASKKKPKVARSTITNADKDVLVDATIFIQFSEEMDPASFTVNSFFLTTAGVTVLGTIGFLNDNTVASFDPSESLQPLTDYTFEVTTDVTDLQGDALAEEFRANFTTGDTVASVEQIVFQRIDFTTGEQGLYLINSDGSNQERLTKRNDVGDAFPDWSHDAQLITFNRSSDQTDVLLMNSDGTFLENLTNSPLSNEVDPAFSPDGSKIAFWSNRDGNQEIYVMNINGTNLINLTSTPDLNEFGLNWSPDGSQIVFTVNRSTFRNDVIVIQNDGTNRRVITENAPFWWPSWSPDGTEIAVLTRSCCADSLVVMDSDGNNPMAITSGDSFTPGISWSPDGNRLAFMRPNEDFLVALAVINKDGSDLQILTPETYDIDLDLYVFSPAWAPRSIRK